MWLRYSEFQLQDVIKTRQKCRENFDFTRKETPRQNEMIVKTLPVSCFELNTVYEVANPLSGVGKGSLHAQRKPGWQEWLS